jgi:hypothetical protein
MTAITLLFSVNTLQYLLFTAIGLTYKMRSYQHQSDSKKWQKRAEHRDIHFHTHALKHDNINIFHTVYRNPGHSTNFSTVPETGT